MSYDGNGTYKPVSPQFPAVTGNIIYAEDFNTIIQDIATALSAVLVRDGQSAMTGDLDMGTKNVKNLTKLVAITAGMVISGLVSFDAAVTMLNTLSVAGNLSAGGNLSVTGSATLTGGGTAVTLAAGTNTNDIATCAFVLQTAMNAALPLQTGNAGKFVTTNGVSASWVTVPPPPDYINQNLGVI